MISESLSPQSYASGRLAGKAASLYASEPVGEKSRVDTRGLTLFKATYSAGSSFLFAYIFTLSRRSGAIQQVKALAAPLRRRKRVAFREAALSAAIARTARAANHALPARLFARILSLKAFVQLLAGEVLALLVHILGRELLAAVFSRSARHFVTRATPLSVQANV
jgi:hypothetical protein